MKEILPLALRSPLFQGMTESELLHLLSCLQAQVITVKKGGGILHQGDPAKFFGVLLRGRAHVVRSDMHGTHDIISDIRPMETFSASFACSSAETMPVGVFAAEDSTVLMLDHRRVLKACAAGCMAHSRLVASLLRAIADKHQLLNEKMEVVTQRTTREKVMAYLHNRQKREGSRHFFIPFDRQGLADYLGVERTALSAELSRLQKDGLIRFRKNEFEVME